jgi:hypothetical protein
MASPNPITLLIRAGWVILLLIALLFASRLWKTHQRKSAIVAEMKAISSDSAYFQQFNAADARKTLLRAISLMHEAERLDLPHEDLIKRAFGIETGVFASDTTSEDLTSRQILIRDNLLLNFINFTKLGYPPDPRLLIDFGKGEIPPIPSGTFQGKRAVIRPIIDPALSPGLEKILPNLQLAPPDSTDAPPTDLEVARAKRLARDLGNAGVIEEPVMERIIAALSEPREKTTEPAPEPAIQ